MRQRAQESPGSFVTANRDVNDDAEHARATVPLEKSRCRESEAMILLLSNYKGVNVASNAVF